MRRCANTAPISPSSASGARERLIACVGPGRKARLAAALKADWLAVYVETPQLQRLSDDRRKRTLDALELASRLGAETITLDGADAAATLIDYARMRNGQSWSQVRRHRVAGGAC